MSKSRVSEILMMAFIILYFIAVVIQLFVPCFFGSILYYKTNRLTVALFHSDWIDKKLPFKRLFLMFMQSVSAPVTILAGRMFKLDMTTFLSVNIKI